MNLNEFTLLKEDNDSYHIQHPSGKKMSVSKALLSGPAMHAIQKMCSGGSVQKFDGGGSVLDDPSLPPVEPGRIAPEPMRTGPSSMDLVSSAPSAVESLAPPEAIQASQQASQQPQVDPMIVHGMSQDQLLSKEQQDIADLQKAQTGESGAAQKAYADYNEKMKTMKTPDQLMADFKAKDDTLMKDYLDNKIDPQNFVHNKMGTGSKIAAGISMIFGGLSQGLIGGKNPGIEWLHNAIQNDIDSQKNQEGKKLTLWKMNHEALGDTMKANLATQNQLWTGVQAKVAQAAAAAQAPVAKYRAQQAINDIEKQKIQNRMTLGLLSQGSEGGGGGFSHADPAQLVEQMVPKELRPQVYKEIGAAQNTIRMSQSINDAFEQAVKENTMLKTGGGYLRTPASVYALHQAMQPTFADLEGTVRQAAMDNTFKNITPMPGDSDHTIETKRRSKDEYLKSKESAPTAKGNGIDLSKFISTSSNPLSRMPQDQQRIYNWAKANPSSEKGRMALEKFRGMGVK